MSNDQQQDTSTLRQTGNPSGALVAALKKLLRPLVRLLLDFQISYPYLSTLLKGIYVEVAESDFPVSDKRPSDSRITLLTGVHRKDVKRLRSEVNEPSVLPRNISTGAQLIAYWMGSSRFCDEQGRPLPLPLREKIGESTSPSFDELVELVFRQDIRPRVILDEWLRLGVAHQDQSGCVMLNTGAFTPEKGFDEKVFFFGKNLHDHIASSAHNLRGGSPAFFDRSVYYDKLSRESVLELETLAKTLGMQALIRMNNQALLLQQQDAAKITASIDETNVTFRMNFGIFHYNDLNEYQVKDSDHA
jgi:hypothetical protein